MAMKKKGKAPHPKKIDANFGTKTDYAKYPKVNPGLTGGKKRKK